MGSRTIDEGSIDEGSGMNFSEYVAVFSGNTDLLEKAKLDNFNETDPKTVGEKLNQLANNARTNGEYFKIGELYGFKILVKTEESQKDSSMFKDNRFFIEGEENIKYSYNNGHIATDPILASKNFLNALEKISNLIEKYQSDSKKLGKDIPVLKEVITSTFKKHLL